MKVVVDANVFISAVICGKNPRAVIDRIVSRQDILLITDEIVAEINEVIRRPKFKSDPKYLEHITKSIECGKMVTIAAAHKVNDSDCTDPKDTMYLECAIAGNADYIISGDMDLRVLKEYRNIKIVNPKEYLDIVGT